MFRRTTQIVSLCLAVLLFGVRRLGRLTGEGNCLYLGQRPD
jgi:hypothetical protein